MLRLLRNIRQKLVARGETRKYYRYVLGEIALVVVGILIALSINNWNERRKNRLTESQYYCKLLADMELDLKSIGQLYDESESKIKSSKQTLRELDSQQKSKAHLINAYISAYRTNAFVPSKAAFTDILSTGKLNLIRDDSLKNSMIRYYAALDNYLYQLELNRSRSLQKAFEYERWVDIGFQHADYVQDIIDAELQSLLPVNDWHLDKASANYKKFQDDLIFFIIMSEREKQFFNAILEEMKPLLQQLRSQCGKQYA